MFADRPQTHHISTTWHNNLRIPSSVSLRAPAALHLQPVRQIWLVRDLFGLYVSGLTSSSSRWASYLIQWTGPLSAFCYLCLNIPRAPFFVAFNIYSWWYFWKDVTTTYDSRLILVVWVAQMHFGLKMVEENTLFTLLCFLPLPRVLKDSVLLAYVSKEEAA